jgi:arsenite-transporting ATPase
VTPDRVVLKESLRAETYLNVFEYPIDAVVLNRVLPARESADPFFAAMIKRQQAIIEEIRADYATLPIFEAPLAPEEPVGRTDLSALARQLFGERDPTDVMHVGSTQRVQPTPEGYLLQVPLPHVEAERLALTKRGDSLYVDVGNVRREIPLPATLAALEPGRARLRGGMLEVPFARSA